MQISPTMWAAAIAFGLSPAVASSAALPVVDAGAFDPRPIREVFFDRQRTESGVVAGPVIVFDDIDPWAICGRVFCEDPTYSYPAYLPLLIVPEEPRPDRRDFRAPAIDPLPRYFPRGVRYRRMVR